MQENTKPTTLKSVSLTDIENVIAKALKDLIDGEEVMCNIKALEMLPPAGNDNYLIDNIHLSLTIKAKNKPVHLEEGEIEF